MTVYAFVKTNNIVDTQNTHVEYTVHIVFSLGVSTILISKYMYNMTQKIFIKRKTRIAMPVVVIL